MATPRINGRGFLFIDFVFKHGGKKYRAREGTGLKDSRENWLKVKDDCGRIEAEMKLGIFDYLKWFPGGNLAHVFTVTGNPVTSTFKDYAEGWLAENAPPNGLKKSTYQDYKSALSCHIYPAIGNRDIKDIDERALKLFRQGLKKRVKVKEGGKARFEEVPMPAKRSNNIFVPIKTIFKEAYRREVIAKDPTEHIRPLEVGRGDIYPLSMQEINVLLPMLPRFWSAFFSVAFFTGMRTGELIALKWRDVDLRAGVIKVRTSITRGEEGLPKTERSQRDVFILAPVMEALEALMEDYLSAGRPSIYIFANGAGNPHNADSIRNRIWLPALKKAGLERRTLYQTRHTFASLMLLAGEDRVWVAEQMGTSLEMLSKTYARYVKSPTRRDGAAFAEMLMATVATE